MQNWQKSRNFRKYKNADGSYTYVITVDSEKVEVNAELYEAYATADRKMEYMEQDLKRDRVLKDKNGKTVFDEQGIPVILPEREMSLDKLIDDDWDFPSSAPSPEDVLLAGECSEVKELYHCIAMLTEDEQALLKSLYFEGKTIREYAEITGQTKSKIDRQKTKIIGKLKNFFTN